MTFTNAHTSSGNRMRAKIRTYHMPVTLDEGRGVTGRAAPAERYAGWSSVTTRAVHGDVSLPSSS
jgi:hypothetical protein